MKRVFDSRMTAHVWAQQNQPDGRNGKNTLFFHNATIYSWRHSYPIGRIFAEVRATSGSLADMDPKPVALLYGGEPFSSSTQRHMRYAWDAVRGSHHLISVERIPNAYDDADAHAHNMTWWASSIAANVAEARRAATNLAMSDRRHLLVHARGIQRTALDYGSLFAVPVPDAVTAFDQRTEMQAYHAARLGAEQARAAKREAMLLKHGDQLVVREGRVAILADARRAVKATQLPWRGYAVRNRIMDAHENLEKFLQEHPGDATAGKWRAMLATWVEEQRAETERRRVEREAEQARAEQERAAAKAMVDGMSREEMIGAIVARTFPNAHLHLVPDDVQIEAWRQGAASLYHTSWSHQTMLRLKPGRPDVIETSRGAEFPTAHGVRAWRILRSLYLRADAMPYKSHRQPDDGRPHLYVRNGATIHLGPFAIDRVEANGDVVAGCHRISRAEVEALATTLGLDVLQTTAA